MNVGDKRADEILELASQCEWFGNSVDWEYAWTLLEFAGKPLLVTENRYGHVEIYEYYYVGDRDKHAAWFEQDYNDWLEDLED